MPQIKNAVYCFYEINCVFTSMINVGFLTNQGAYFFKWNMSKCRECFVVKQIIVCLLLATETNIVVINNILICL